MTHALQEADRLSHKYVGESFTDLVIRGARGYSPSLYLTSGESHYKNAGVIRREKARLASLFNAAMKAGGSYVRAFTDSRSRKPKHKKSFITLRANARKAKYL